MEQHFVRQPPARAAARAVSASWPIFASIALLMFGNGLQGTLLGMRATQEGFGALVTGAVMAGYYAGFIASSFGTPQLIRRIGHVRCYAAFAAAASVAVLVHGLVVEPAVWGAMRLVTGFCLAGIYIVSESWLNGRSENVSRGSVIALYNMVLLLSVAGGQLVVSLGEPGGLPLFLVASILVSLAVLPMVLSVRPSPEPDTPERFGLRELFAASPLGVVVALGAGLVFGAYGGMGAAYATGAGLSTTEVAVFMTAMTLAGGLAQWPLGRLSDWLPRRFVILATTAAATLAALYASSVPAAQAHAHIAAAAGFGALALPLYSLGNAITNDRVPQSKRVAAGSTLVLLYGCGSVVGPLVAASAIALFGDPGFFLGLAAICGTLAAWALVRLAAGGRRSPDAEANQGSAAKDAPRSSSRARSTERWQRASSSQ